MSLNFLLEETDEIMGGNACLSDFFVLFERLVNLNDEKKLDEPYFEIIASPAKPDTHWLLVIKNNLDTHVEFDTRNGCPKNNRDSLRAWLEVKISIPNGCPVADMKYGPLPVYVDEQGNKIQTPDLLEKGYHSIPSTAIRLEFGDKFMESSHAEFLESFLRSFASDHDEILGALGCSAKEFHSTQQAKLRKPKPVQLKIVANDAAADTPLELSGDAAHFKRAL